MKKSAYLICLLFIVAFSFLTSSAKAQDEPCNGGDPVTGACPVPPSESPGLPVNGGVVYLLVAGAVVGVMAIKKQKNAIIKA
jgi:hypothetical protein